MPDEPSDKPETPASPEGAPAGEPAASAGETAADDAARPEAIARRVAALGEEDEADRVARLEEEKLAERRAQAKGPGKKKSGLEAAASKRLSKIGTKAPARRPVGASDVDPLLKKTSQFGRWAKENQGLVTGLGIAAFLALIGLGGYTWWHQRREAQASAIFSEALSAERGRIGDPDKEQDEDRPKDPRPVFKTEADKREAALTKYREVVAKFGGTGPGYLARLEEGGLLLDKGDLDGALAAYREASTSPLAKADAEVRGRAMEGIGFVHEMRAQADAANAPAHLDDAIKAFRELENTDVLGFKELGMYHEARCYEAKGDKDKAIELLKSLHERLAKPGENHPFPYLEVVADDRLRALDPSAVPAKPAGALGGPGGNKMSDAQMKALIEQLKKQQQEQQKNPAPEKKE